MNHFLKIFVLFLILSGIRFNSLFAQEGKALFSLHGKFTTKQKLTAGDVVIYLLQANDKKLVKVEYATDNGEFNFEKIPGGNYRLTTQSMTFKKIESELIQLNKDTDLGQIPLETAENTLKEISVSAIKPFIKQHYDKMVLDVANSISAVGSTALEVLQKAPGITLDQSDNIAMRGRQGVLVMIDGKLVPMSGQDLANLLRSMSANQIEKIDLITSPSAKYDAAGNSGIIDIHLKKGKNEGTNGNLTLSYSQGIYGKVMPSFNINTKKNKVNLFASYAYAPRRDFTDLTIFRTFYNTENESTGGNNYNNFFRYRFNSHNARLGADYKLNDKITLGIAASGLFNSGAVFSDSKAKSFNAAQQFTGAFNTLGNTRPVRNNGSINFNYRQLIDTNGKELNMDFDYAHYSNDDQQNYITSYFDNSGNPVKSPYLLFGDLTGNLNITSFKADYTQPLKRMGIKLETGLKASWVKSDNDIEFFDRSNGGNVLDQGKSNRFIYKENIYAAYLNASRKWKKLTWQLGLRLENTVADGLQVVNQERFSKNYVQLFPSGYLGYEINPSHDLGISLSRRINRPSYRQLNPFKVFLDPLTSSSGNPMLDPEITYTFELSHTFKQKLMTKVGYSRTTDNIITVLSPDTEPNSVIQTGRNLARFDYYNVSIGFPVTLSKWFSSTNTVLAYYGKYQGNLANTNLNAGRVSVNLNSVNTLYLNASTSFEVTGVYNSRNYYGFLDVGDIWSLTIGAQKQFWNKRASVKLNMSDIFWSDRTKATTKLTGYAERFIQKRDTRIGTISFNYKFGGGQPASKRKTGGAEEEKKRAG